LSIIIIAAVLAPSDNYCWFVMVIRILDFNKRFLGVNEYSLGSGKNSMNILQSL